MTSKRLFDPTVFEVAIGTTPDQGIKASQTTTVVSKPGKLSLLALGAVGPLALRKKR